MDEDIESVEEIDRLLAGEEVVEKPKPPKSIAKMPPGKIVAAIMEATDTPMTPEERDEIESIGDDEAMAAFMEANLGKEPFIGELKARSLFGSYMLKKMNHKAIGFACSYVNISSTQKCIEFAMGLANKEGATDRDKINAGKLWLVANRELSIMLKRYGDMAQLLAPDTQKETLNKAPDIFVENAQILVQQPSSG